MSRRLCMLVPMQICISYLAYKGSEQEREMKLSLPQETEKRMKSE